MVASLVVQSRADQVLQQSPIPALRRLSVEENDRTIVLSGSVSSYYLKQLAQETVMPILVARQLDNRVRVVARLSRRAGGISPWFLRMIHGQGVTRGLTPPARHRNATPLAAKKSIGFGSHGEGAGDVYRGLQLRVLADFHGHFGTDDHVRDHADIGIRAAGRAIKVGARSSGSRPAELSEACPRAESSPCRRLSARSACRVDCPSAHPRPFRQSWRSRHRRGSPTVHATPLRRGPGTSCCNRALRPPICPCVVTITPEARNRSTTRTAASNEPPGLPRKSRISTFMPAA